MTNAELIAKIKAEIERLIEESDFDESANLYSLLSFLDTLESEKPVPNGLEEAAEEYAYRGIPEEIKPYVKHIAEQIIKNFIAGAKWQADNAPLLEDTVIWNDGFKTGREVGERDMKEQMMKEAVEADVMLTLHDKTGDVSLHTGYLPKELGIKCDDKVKIIIVKE